MSNIIYGWNTKKVGKGFKWNVTKMTTRKTKNSIGHYADTKVIKSGILPTRARAKLMAQRWVRYYDSKKR